MNITTQFNIGDKVFCLLFSTWHEYPICKYCKGEIREFKYAKELNKWVWDGPRTIDRIVINNDKTFSYEFTDKYTLMNTEENMFKDRKSVTKEMNKRNMEHKKIKKLKPRIT